MRMIFLICTTTALCLWMVIPDQRLIPIPAMESSAVKTLIKMQLSLYAEKAKLEQRGFGPTLPAIEKTFPIQRYYSFEYFPHRSTTGVIDSFEIGATLMPRARQCGCIRSFLMTSDGNIHYTADLRPAIASDLVVNVPPGISDLAPTR